MKPPLFGAALAATLALSACAATGAGMQTARSSAAAAETKAAPANDFARQNAFPSTYKPQASTAVFIQNATIYDGRGGRIEGGSILLEGGKITAVGQDISAPAGAEVIVAQGRYVTPGIIDVHSHLGSSASPGVSSHYDTNESTQPVTADVWVEHSVWPGDPGFGRALAGGVTALQILPGSANLVGGRTVTLKNVPSRTVQGMKFPSAPYGMKMACGENPKRTYGNKGRSPKTRMGNIAGYRAAWIKAENYKAKWDAYAQDGGRKPGRDLENETLAGVLAGDIIVHMHCYRGDEMAQLIDVAREFDYKIGTFHHAAESYKIADLLREADICSAMWADRWGFKMEAYDGIRENIPMVHAAGACAIVHSDDTLEIQRLNQEAAKAWADGRAAGLEITAEEAWTWLSYNPAKSLGIDDQTGSLEVGKMADIVLWSGDPFSVYTRADQVYVDGALLYDRMRPDKQPISDFELGQPGEGDVK